MNRDCLRTGDKASVHFRFIKTPEYLHCDQKLVFREGRTKAVGTITKVVRLFGWITWHTPTIVELANVLTSASSPAAAVHQQFAIQFQTPTNQNAVYQEGAGQKGGRQRGCQ